MLIVYGHQKPFRNNLTYKERENVRTLGERENILIKPADEGCTVVVIVKDEYIYEAHRQLCDASFYRELPGDPREPYKTFMV